MPPAFASPFSTGWLPLALIAALVAAVVMLRNFFEGNRTKAFQDAAIHLGLTFEGKEWARNSRAPQMETPLFARGNDRQTRNIMTGNRSGLDVSFFDYSYRLGRDATQQTVAAFSQDFWFPQFEIAPQGIVHLFDKMVFRKDIHFESNPVFSKRFHLRSVDEAKVRELFTPALLTFLEGLDPKAPLHIEGSGKTLVIYRLGRRIKPDQFPAFVDETTALAKSFLALADLRKSPAS